MTSISFQTEIGSIQIQLNPGSTILVAGANGVGKSALLYTLYRSLPQDHATYLPGHRQIYFNSGWDAVSQDAAQLRSNLFMHADQFSRIKSAWAEDQFKVSIRTLLHAESAYNRDFRILTSQHLYSSEENAALKLSPVDTLNLVFKGARLPVQFILDNSGLSAERDGVVYAIDALSDGERAALFLVAAIVVQSENSVILIDEPEKHLHPSITSLLIEVALRARPDIITVLSTHDVHLIERLQVAQVIHVRNSRVTSLKPEVRVFDAEILTDINSISEDLKRELLGSRYKLLFVEGENNSSDLALYSHVYQDFKVSPKGGHEKVSEAVKALKGLTANHWLKPYGIIDGDGRDIKEIRALETHGIHVLKFPSIENLFFQKEVISCFVDAQLTYSDGGTLDKRLESLSVICYQEALKHREELINRRVSWALERRLSEAKLSPKEIGQHRNEVIEISLDDLFQSFSLQIDSVLNQKSWESILTYLPIKHTTIPHVSAQCVGAKSFDEYVKVVLRQFDIGSVAAHRAITSLRAILPILTTD